MQKTKGEHDDVLDADLYDVSGAGDHRIASPDPMGFAFAQAESDGMPVIDGANLAEAS